MRNLLTLLLLLIIGCATTETRPVHPFSDTPFTSDVMVEVYTSDQPAGIYHGRLYYKGPEEALIRLKGPAGLPVMDILFRSGRLYFLRPSGEVVYTAEPGFRRLTTPDWPVSRVSGSAYILEINLPGKKLKIKMTHLREGIPEGIFKP